MKWGSTTIRVYTGDITRVGTRAIVNAANSSLMGGGGVDGAIHRAGGPAILDACRSIPERPGGRCPTGEAVITTGGRLPARFVIHTVGPIYRDGRHGEPEKLRNCYWNSLSLALEKEIATVAFPSISTGVYGYPIREAAAVALSTVREFCERTAASNDAASAVTASKESASGDPDWNAAKPGETERRSPTGSLKEVHFVLFSESDLRVYKETLVHVGFTEEESAG